MFIDLQDAYNVQRDYGLGFQGSDPDEFASLQQNLEEQTASLSINERTILYLKRPGYTDQLSPDLPVGHFVAVVQTEYQREMLLRHASKGICIDSTHGCFAEDSIKLTTILVLDENERGIPVGHCFLSNEDIPSCRKFFVVLRDQLQHIGNLMNF
jgi:hypothetical protein